MSARDFDDYPDSGDRRWSRIVVILLGVGALAVLGVVTFRAALPDSPQRASTFRVPASSTTTSTTDFFVAEPFDTTLVTDTTAVPVTNSGAPSSVVEALPPVPPTDDTNVPPGSTAPRAPTFATSTTLVTDPPSGEASSSPTVAPGTPYPTEADGSARPIVAVFDTDTITLTGQVPSQAAADRLTVLAVANSQTPATVVNNLIVNPSVPIGVGVRVLELNSPRFPESSSTILPAHAAELDRVVSVMRSLPNVTVLVIGHADQRGSQVGNFAISDARARAVVNYLVYLGISPARLSSRAVGDSDLLAAGDDAVSLALNRRTEFVFYGLLIS